MDPTQNAALSVFHVGAKNGYADPNGMHCRDASIESVSP